MTVLLEDPLPYVFFGIIAEAVLAVVLLRTGRGVALLGMVAVALVVLLGIGVEWAVVTEREEVEAAIDGVAAALEANDLQGVLGFVDPKAIGTRQRAEWALGRVEVLEANARNLQVTINRFTSPPTATAEFNGIIRVRDRKGQFPYENYTAKFTVELRRHADRWLITEHVEHDRFGT